MGKVPLLASLNVTETSPTVRGKERALLRGIFAPDSMEITVRWPGSLTESMARNVTKI